MIVLVIELISAGIVFSIIGTSMNAARSVAASTPSIPRRQSEPLEEDLDQAEVVHACRYEVLVLDVAPSARACSADKEGLKKYSPAVTWIVSASRGSA